MNILILANHYAVASGRYAAKAFELQGHRVYTDGPVRGRNIWGLALPAWATWEPRPAPPDLQLDLVIVMDSDPAVLDMSEQYEDPIVWGVDNHVRDYRRSWITRYYLAHREVSLHHWDRDCIHLPCAGDPGLFTPSPIAWVNRPFDVGVLGVMYPERWAAVEQLRAAGLSVLAGAGLVGQSYARATQSARVSLCLPVANDLAQRVFECAQADTAVLTREVPDFKYFAPRGLTFLKDDDDLVSVCSALSALGREDALESSRWAVQHSWFARARSLINNESRFIKYRASLGLPESTAST